MRTAQICPTCATFINAKCVLYDGDFLTNTNIAPLDSIETAIVKINNNLVPLTGAYPPSISSTYLGQLYIDITGPTLYYSSAVGTGPGDWNILCNCTTTTTTTVPPTTTTTTTT
jgi:hypothetical protein